MKTKCNESKGGCSSAVIEKDKNLHRPSTFFTGQSISEIQEKKVLCTCNDTSMTKPSIVHDPTKNVSRECTFFLIMNRAGERSVASVIKKNDSFSFKQKCFDMIYVNYLAVLFNLNLKYNTINLHRSVYDEELDLLPISKNSKVKNLMTGIYNKRPAKPKICFYLGFRSSS